LQSQIALASHEAGLFTYLDHPWPRTQILAHLIQTLPPAIEITQIHLTEQDNARPQAPQAPARSRPGGDDTGGRLLPAEQDLRKLRAEVDRRQTVAEIAGTTSDVAELHQYVADLNRSPLVAFAQIKLIDAAAKDAREPRTRFGLRVQIQTGHGQSSSQRPAATAATRAPTATQYVSAASAPPRPTAEGGGE
jgi:hypothetical protein